MTFRSNHGLLNERLQASMRMWQASLWSLLTFNFDAIDVTYDDHDRIVLITQGDRIWYEYGD